MAVNPLDPTKPTLTDQSIELVEELRAMKQRLVTDKANIEQIQNTIIDIQGIGAFGAELLASTDEHDAREQLGFSPYGELLVQYASAAALAGDLGVVSPAPILTAGVGKWCIQFADSTIKINIVKATFNHTGAGGTAVLWQVPFVTGAFAIVGNLQANADRAIWTSAETLNGCTVNHNNGSAHPGVVIAIGI